MRLLVIEDEPALGSAVLAKLRSHGHAADWYCALEDARSALAATEYDFLVLDLGLPDGNGLDLVRSLRSEGAKLGILVATARDQISDRIAGLSEGADDYIVKPYDLDELMARIDAISRRNPAYGGAVVTLGDVEIDLTRRRLSRAGAEIDLTAREWAVIELLARRPGAICSRSRIEDALYDHQEDIESNTIEVFISRVRKKIGRDIILTARGRGYRLADP